MLACGLQIFHLTHAPGKSGKGNELFSPGVKGNGDLGFWAWQLVQDEVSCHVEDGSGARGWGRDTGTGSDPGCQASSSRLGDYKASWEGSVQA